MSRIKSPVLIKHIEQDVKEETKQARLRDAYKVEGEDITIKESGIKDSLVRIARLILYILIILLALIGLLVLFTPYLRYLLMEEIKFL